MGKLLLTTGQVQVLVSSAFVAGITFFLFLAGYTIQQHSVATLQSQLKPRIPIAPISNTAKYRPSGLQKPSRLFDPERNSRISEQITSQQETSIDWTKLAHVQLVTTHHDVCNAIMLFGDLARLKSPARRILLFPQPWALEKQAAKHEMIDPYMDSTRRLLRRAARRYNVELRPFPSSAQQTPLTPLTHLWSLIDLERILLLQTPALINNAEVLDGILAYTPLTPLTLLLANDTTNLTPNDLILLTPNTQTHRILTTSSPQNLSAITSLLHPSYSPFSSLMTSIAVLHDAITPNKTAFLEYPYIRFSDYKLPGPEWEVEYKRVVDARPRDKDADWLWTKLYGEFAGRRYEVCGLGLEVWRE